MNLKLYQFNLIWLIKKNNTLNIGRDDFSIYLSDKDDKNLSNHDDLEHLNEFKDNFLNTQKIINFKILNDKLI